MAFLLTDRLVKPMKPQEIIYYCLKKDGAYLDFPFGEIPIVVKVCDKIFAEVYPKSSDYKITLKCEAVLSELYRSQYPGVVIHGYHVLNSHKPYWNTVYPANGIEESEIYLMLDHSYNEVVKKLKKSKMGEA